MKDCNNVYELLNYMEIDLDDYDRVMLSDIEKQRLKNSFKKNKRRRILKQISAIAAIFLLTIGLFSQTTLGKSVYAAVQLKVAEISYSIGKSMGIERNIEPYENVVNQIVADNGIEVKLSSVIIDKDELIFSTIVNTNKAVDKFRFDYDIFINGKKLTNYGATGRAGRINDSNSLFFLTYAVDIKGIDLKEHIDIKIVLKDMELFTEDLRETRKGKWHFEFTANGSELMANSHTIPIGYSFNIDNQKYILQEFRLNPVNQKIYGKVKGAFGARYDVYLRGHDDLGNEVVFYLASVSGEDLVFKYSNIYGDLSDEITSLTLTPYAAELPEKSGKMSDDYKQVGEEFTIHLKK